MNALLEMIIPKRLSRLPYFVRMVACNAVLATLRTDIEASRPSGVAGLVIVLGYVIGFVLLPRIRDTGMSSRWIWLALVPGVNLFLSCALLFRGSEFRHSRSTQPLNDTASDALANEEAQP